MSTGFYIFLFAFFVFVLLVALWCFNATADVTTRIGRIIHSIYIYYLIFIVLIVICGSIFFSIRDKINSIKSDDRSNNSQDEEFDASYASGYDDALHGIRPSVYDVKCFSCGSSYSDFTEIHFYEVSSVFVPICESCVMDHDRSNPLEILGEEYIFSPSFP